MLFEEKFILTVNLTPDARLYVGVFFQSNKNMHAHLFMPKLCLH